MTYQPTTGPDHLPHGIRMAVVQTHIRYLTDTYVAVNDNDKHERRIWLCYLDKHDMKKVLTQPVGSKITICLLQTQAESRNLPIVNLYIEPYGDDRKN